MAYTILVVEDEPILGLELQEDLTSKGFTVPPVICDGDSVMPAVLKYRPDAIIMDIKLFGFRDGIDAANRVRGFFNTPIVYLSSYPEKEVSGRIEKTSPWWYLEKPYCEEKLFSTLHLALNAS